MTRTFSVLAALGALAAAMPASTVHAAARPASQASDECAAFFTVAEGPEPLSSCQWDMRAMNVEAARSHATGDGVVVGVIDSGVDSSHPDLAANFNMPLSCSFIFSDTPTADPLEVANGDCSNKAAVEDLQGHGTHVASTIAGAVNGIGIAGVAPEATIVSLKACTIAGFCFADSVAAALRYAGDHGIDVVNLSLFSDPFLYYCKNDAEQRAILKELTSKTNRTRNAQLATPYCSTMSTSAISPRRCTTCSVSIRPRPSRATPRSPSMASVSKWPLMIRRPPRVRRPSSTRCWAPEASGTRAGSRTRCTPRRLQAGRTSTRTGGSCSTSRPTAASATIWRRRIPTSSTSSGRCGSARQGSTTGSRSAT